MCERAKHTQFWSDAWAFRNSRKASATSEDYRRASHVANTVKKNEVEAISL